MLTYIKKDLLLFWRNRREIATVVLLPIVLIVVLNFAFSGLFGTHAKPLDLTLAVVNEDRDPAGKEQLLAFLQSPDFSEWLTVRELDKTEAFQQVEEGKVDAAIHIPEGYSHLLMNPDVRKDAAGVELPLTVKKSSLNVDVIQEILGGYFGAMNLQFALAHASIGDDGAPSTGVAVSAPEGGREMIEGAKPFTMSQYFTLAMGALFALFIASSVAERTGTEKREQVFYRILVTNTKPLAYLMGKTVSTFCLVWLQNVFVILVSHLLLGVFKGHSANFWLGLMLMVTGYALTIACLTALYTSISLRVRSMDTANALFLLITMGFGVLGGGFFPIYLFPHWLQEIGEWTPNGLILTMHMEWIQYGQLSSLWTPLFGLMLFAAAGIAAGVAFYPKRGEV